MAVEYPCDKCTKVEDPNKCENKRCLEWKEWFLKAWSKFNSK